MPVVLALLEIWYVNFFGAQTRAVIPYSEICAICRRTSAARDGIEREARGPRRERSRLRHGSRRLGRLSTPSQHSFHQLLHQGTHLNPVDFIVIDETGAVLPGKTRS